MAINPSFSPKIRALEQAYGQTSAEVVKAYAPTPYTYTRIAEEWQAKVAECYPDLNLKYSYQDVFALFSANGIARKPRLNKSAGPTKKAA